MVKFVGGVVTRARGMIQDALLGKAKRAWRDHFRAVLTWARGALARPGWAGEICAQLGLKGPPSKRGVIWNMAPRGDTRRKNYSTSGRGGKGRSESSGSSASPPPWQPEQMLCECKSGERLTAGGIARAMVYVGYITAQYFWYRSSQ